MTLSYNKRKKALKPPPPRKKKEGVKKLRNFIAKKRRYTEPKN